MRTMNLRVIQLVMAAGLLSSSVLAAEMPAAPRMPPPAPGKGGGQPAQQPTSEQLKQMQREYERKKDNKPRKGNEQEPFGGGNKDKEKDKELSVTGVLELTPATTGTPESFTIKDAEGKAYTLDGRETTLRRLVGKNVELEGETDKKTGALKVKTVREAKAKSKDKVGDKKTTKI